MSSGAHQRLDNIRSILNTFRQEQEQLILKSTDDHRFRSSKSNIAPPISLNDASNEDVYLSRVLNVESVVMPVGNTVSAGQKLWPQAMISGRIGDTARMGNIESSGSLWKLVQRKDGNPGTRVIIQAAEIGEELTYLSPTLQLVQNKLEAAVWNLRAAAQPIDVAVSDAFSSSSADAKNVARGLNVLFELVESRSSVGNDHEERAIKKDTKKMVLCCRYSPLKATTELCIVPYDTIVQQQMRDASEIDPAEMQYSFLWEVCPESWISDELDFLDRFLT